MNGGTGTGWAFAIDCSVLWLSGTPKKVCGFSDQVGSQLCPLLLPHPQAFAFELELEGIK